MDWKFALRGLRKNPGFTALAVLVMALGIGANTAVFSVVNTVLLKPLDYPAPDRIVRVSTYWKRSGTHGQVSAPDFHDWHDQSTSFSALAYYRGLETAVTAGATTEYTHATVVTPEFFGVFEVKPTAGRLFSPEEEKPGSGGAAVISYAYWQSHFGGSPAALGAKIRILDKTVSVTGVLAPGFGFPGHTDVWYPANTMFPEVNSRGGHNYQAVGRLKPSVSVGQAQAEMNTIGARLEREYPSTNTAKGVLLNQLQDEMTADVRTTLYLLLGSVGLVLLIACANMANLLLARATARTREIAIRAAVGASRWRILRQLIVESVVLGAVSGAAGLLLAAWGASALVALAPANVPRLAEIGIDGRVLAFTLAVSMAASLLFGLAPAIHASRVDLNDALKQGAARLIGAGRGGRLRSGLVVAEIALSVVLLAGAGLLLKSFMALENVDLGFRPERVLLMDSQVPVTAAEVERRARFYQELLGSLDGMPGVQAVGATRSPAVGIGSNGSYEIDHLDLHAVFANLPNAVFSVVAPETFRTLGIPLKRGRDFSAVDTADVAFVCVVNEALVRQSFRGQDPIGHIIYWGLDNGKPMRIVGVVGDRRQGGPGSPPHPEIFGALDQHASALQYVTVVVRTTGEPGAMSAAVRRKAQEISPDVPVKFTTMQAQLAENIAAPRFRAMLLGIFAGLAVLLAMAGVYGVMAYVVGQRAGEIGLRMALGASAGDVLRLLLRQGMGMAAVGLGIGLAGALVATRALEKMLFGVKSGDASTYFGVVLLLAAAAAAACYFPARRAARLDPVAALREE